MPVRRFHFEGRNNDETLQSLKAMRSVRGTTGSWRQYCAPGRVAPCISVEIEKMHGATEQLYGMGDVVFLSKEFAGKLGLATPEEFLLRVAPLASPGSVHPPPLSLFCVAVALAAVRVVAPARLVAAADFSGCFQSMLFQRWLPLLSTSVVCCWVLPCSALLICPWGAAGAVALDLSVEGAGTGEIGIIRSPAFPPASGVVDSIGAGDTFTAAMIAALGGGAAADAALRFACKVAGAKVGVPGFVLPNVGDIRAELAAITTAAA